MHTEEMIRQALRVNRMRSDRERLQRAEAVGDIDSVLDRVQRRIPIRETDRIVEAKVGEKWVPLGSLDQR